MLTPFDWLRECRTGGELMAALEGEKGGIDLYTEENEIAPPLSLFDHPCSRCWIYRPDDKSPRDFCTTCESIYIRSRKLGKQSRQTLLVWGYVNEIPDPLRRRQGFYEDRICGAYVHDLHRFLLAMDRREIKPWLQELLMYNGHRMKGLLQFFPTTGEIKQGNMGDALCRVIQQESRYPMNQLRVRFFSHTYQVFGAHRRDMEENTIFEAPEFIRLLEMAAVFKSLLRPEAQQMLFDLFRIDDIKEERFYWGRFMGFLTPEARDMLNAWKIRQWPKPQIRLLYDLLDYVFYTH